MKKVGLWLYAAIIIIMTVSAFWVHSNAKKQDNTHTPKLDIVFTNNAVTYDEHFPSQQLYDRLKMHVLKLEVIHHTGMGLKTKSSGSATVITHNGYLITNSHVIKGAHRIIARSDDFDQRLKVKVVKNYPKYDLALIKVDYSFEHPFKFAKESSIPGSEVWAMGYPIDLPLSLSRGSIGALNTDYDILEESKSDDRYTQVSMLLQRGFSGGPLINEKGELAGLITAIINQGEAYTGLSMAIPIETIKEVLTDDTYMY